jgi:hypothetical protein
VPFRQFDLPKFLGTDGCNCIYVILTMNIVQYKGVIIHRPTLWFLSNTKDIKLRFYF